MMKAILRIYSEAYRGFPREVWMLCAVHFVNRTGSMVLAFLTLYLTKALGYSLGAASQVLAVYGCGYLAGGLVGGWLCDRLGALRILFLSLALSGLGFFVLERLRSLPAIMVTTFLVAVAAESFNPANLSALAAFSTPGRLNRVVALNRTAVNLAVALAPAIGGWLVMRDYALIFWVEGTAGLAAAALLAFLFRSHAAKAQPASEPAPSGFDVHPLRDGAFLAFLGLNFLSMLISMQVLGTYPVYLTQVYGMAESHFGLLMTLNGLLILLFEMVITHCTETFSTPHDDGCRDVPPRPRIRHPAARFHDAARGGFGRRLDNGRDARHPGGGRLGGEPGRHPPGQVHGALHHDLGFGLDRGPAGRRLPLPDGRTGGPVARRRDARGSRLGRIRAPAPL